jgi:excisionase family DNA binding protein
MTVREVAARLEVTPATVYALCAAGKLGHLRVGVGKGAIRITEADLAAYVAACRVAPRDSDEEEPALEGPRRGRRDRPRDIIGEIERRRAARRRA